MRKKKAKKPSLAKRALMMKNSKTTAAKLRAEGVVFVGRAEGTSLLYVRTKERFYVFHTCSVPERALDAYAVELAVNWIENGLSAEAVARNLAVTPANLSAALKRAGYVHQITPNGLRLRASRADKKFGNRRGPLIRVEPTPAEPQPRHSNFTRGLVLS